MWFIGVLSRKQAILEQKLKRGVKTMEQNIFTKIMNLIERETDIPNLEQNTAEWLKKDAKNENIYKIYMLASSSREL